MANLTFTAFFVVGGNARFAHKAAQSGGAAHRKLRLYQAIRSGNYLMASLAEKAGNNAAFAAANGIYCLVSIALAVFVVSTEDLISTKIHPRNAGKGIVYARELKAQLLIIAHMLKITAAAFAESRTGRGDALGRGAKKLDTFGIGSRACYL